MTLIRGLLALIVPLSLLAYEARGQDKAEKAEGFP